MKIFIKFQLAVLAVFARLGMSVVIDRSYDNVRLTSYVREVAQRTDGFLARFLPNRFRQTRTFKVRTYTPGNGAASFRGFDTPSPIIDRRGYDEKVGSLPPISEAAIIGEDERLGIYERALAGDWDAQTDAAIYDDAAELTMRINNRIEQARGQMLETGSFDLTISSDGIVASADFERPAGNAVTAVATWANPASDMITDIRTVVEKQRDETPYPLEFMICSSTTITRMLLNDGIRALLKSQGEIPELINEEALGRVMSSFGFPSIVRYDYKVDGTRVIKEDIIIFTPTPSETVGETQWGTTAEALELQLDFGSASGLTGLVLTNEHPVNKMTNVSGIVMPTLGDANAIYTLDTVP